MGCWHDIVYHKAWNVLNPNKKGIFTFVLHTTLVDKIKVTLYLFGIIESDTDQTTFDLKNVGRDECA